MKKLKFYAKWQDGKFEWTSPDWVREKMNELPDCNLVITMEKDFGKRSLSQNAYLHGVVIPLVFEGLREAGFDEVKDNEDAKTVIKNLFLKEKISNGIETFEIIKDTHKLSTKEMVKFIEEVCKWAAEYLSINIPAPNTQSKMFAV